MYKDHSFTNTATHSQCEKVSANNLRTEQYYHFTVTFYKQTVTFLSLTRGAVSFLLQPTHYPLQTLIQPETKANERLDDCKQTTDFYQKPINKKGQRQLNQNHQNQPAEGKYDNKVDVYRTVRLFLAGARCLEVNKPDNANISLERTSVLP